MSERLHQEEIDQVVRECLESFWPLADRCRCGEAYVGLGPLCDDGHRGPDELTPRGWTVVEHAQAEAARHARRLWEIEIDATAYDEIRFLGEVREHFSMAAAALSGVLERPSSAEALCPTMITGTIRDGFASLLTRAGGTRKSASARWTSMSEPIEAETDAEALDALLSQLDE